MLQDALFAPERNVGTKAVVLPLAALAHGLLALLLVTLPLVRSGDLPRVELTGVFLAPAPPVPPPPPPKARGRSAATARRIKPVRPMGAGNANVLVTPVEIPDVIADEALDWGGSGEGVEWGVDYGAGGGAPTNFLGVAMGKVIGKEADQPVRAVGEVRMPRLIKRVEPVYPEIPRDARIQGTVILEATTDIYGRVAAIKILRSIPLLDEAAVNAVRQWLYEPMVINGRPRAVVFTVTVRFELKK